MSKRDYVSDFQLFTWFHDMLLELSNIFLQSISFLNFPGLILKNGIFVYLNKQVKLKSKFKLDYETNYTV